MRTDIWRNALRLATATIVCAAGVVNTGPASAQTRPADDPPTRNALTWPFAQNSIWNMPIGSRAQYQPAGFAAPTARGTGVDENIIVESPAAPQQDIVQTNAGWSGAIRCNSIVSPTVTLYQNVPIPHDFFTDPKGAPNGYLGNTPNQSAALLEADGQTVIQTQPFHRCTDGQAVSEYKFPNANIFTGDGIRGAHGGSGLSSLGGTIRTGELSPGSVIHHALQFETYGKKYLAACAITDNHPYRWPAVTNDGGACSGSYGGTNSGIVQGTLLALPPTFDVSQLQTEPARIIARALINYGAYIVDDTGWDTNAFTTEWSPTGRVYNQVQSEYGIVMGSTNPTTSQNIAFNNDMNTIVTSMDYISNNDADHVGGGGTPRQPLAPPFCQGAKTGCEMPSSYTRRDGGRRVRQ